MRSQSSRKQTKSKSGYRRVQGGRRSSDDLRRVSSYNALELAAVNTGDDVGGLQRVSSSNALDLAGIVPSPYQRLDGSGGTGRGFGPLSRSSSSISPSKKQKSGRRTRKLSRSSSDVSPSTSPPKTVGRLKKTISMIMLGGEDDDEAERTDDSDEHLRPHESLFTRKWKVRLVLITAVFLIATALARWIQDEEQEGEGGVYHDGKNALEDIDLRQSCGEFFETNDIMALKQSSTVENLEYGAVASDNKMCSEVGTSILRDYNGNAVDAAVATTLCLGVVNPASSGMGGGGFILIHADAQSHTSKVGSKDYFSPAFEDDRGTKEPMLTSTAAGDAYAPNAPNLKVTEFIDCRETAPAGSAYDMFEKLPPRASLDGGLAIGVPGELRGLELAHYRHGKLPWAEVVRPAMELARDGFGVSQHLAHDIETNRKKIFSYAGLQHLLTKDHDGVTLLQEGDILKQTTLAETLQAIMDDGADAIYAGERAAKIAIEIKKAGGVITKSDLANYRPAVRDPLIAHDVFGFSMVGAPPPSSGGGAVIGAARFLSGYKTPMSSFADTLSKHRFAEACKHVFAMRMSLSDPDFNRNVTANAIKDMIEGNYMEHLRRKSSDTGILSLSLYGGSRWSQMDDTKGNGTLADASEGDRRERRDTFAGHRETRLFNYLEDNGTTSLSVVDKDRNSVSISSTLNTYFGSGIVSPSTGLIFNNQMDDFSTPGRVNYFGLEPSEANYISPGKRPLSSMSPTMVFRRSEKMPNEESELEGLVEELGDFVLCMGASGGPKIITAVLQTFLNYNIMGMPLFESVANPRIHNQLLYHGAAATTYDNSTLLQGPTLEVTNRTLSALKSRGHRLLSVDYLGTVQAVAVDLETNRLAAVSDIRKGGSPAGY